MVACNTKSGSRKSQGRRKGSYSQRRKAIPDIVADARTLGVSRVTLWRLLHGKTGQFQLKTLRRRYDELQAAKAAKEEATT